MATPEALAALAARTDDPSHERREAAARAIGKMADPRQAPLLRAMLADKSPSVRRAAAGSLGLLGDLESAPALLVLTDDAEAETRSVALRALLALGGSDHGPMVTKALADADDKVRLEALDGVRSLGIQAASAALLHALSDGSDAVRQRAACLLAATAGERALEPLVQLLDQPKAAMVAAGAHALGTIGGPRARRLLLERLHSDSSIFWAPCSAALQAEGWLPTSPIDVVRDGAARGDWTGCLALGSGAVNELRAVLRLGDELMRRGAAATLHTMGWTPGEPNTEWFSYAVARADWQTEKNQRPGERPSLLGWFKGHPLSRGPVRGLVEELLPSLTMPLAGRGLDEALSDSDLLRRYVATIASGLASCDVAVPLLLDNLNAPDDDAHPVFHYGMIRVASAQALGEMKNLADVPNLLKHAACGIPSGVGTYSNFSAVTAVQSAWRCVGFADLFECIPALALGRKRENDSKRVVIDLWSHFPLADLSVLERYSVSAFVTALAAFDRSKLPAFSVLYSDFAFWELQTRLAVLALVCMAGTHETFFMHSDLKSAASLALT